MTASSVTGSGNGASNKATNKELAMLSNGPAIYVADYIEATGMEVSPPTSGNLVTFPSPLPGEAANYVVMLTTQNAGSAYINEFIENADGDFKGFSFISGADGPVMYMVVSKGYRPSII